MKASSFQAFQMLALQQVTHKQCVDEPVIFVNFGHCEAFFAEAIFTIRLEN